MIQRWRRARALCVATLLAAGTLIAALSHLAHGTSHGTSGIAFEIADSRAAWTLPELHPGRVTVVPGAHQLTVVSQTPWELAVTSRLLEMGAADTIRSAVYLGVSNQSNQLDENPRGTEWIPVSTHPSTLNRRGGPTGPDGDAVSIDLQIDPSWDDPPGVPYVAEVTATLAAGDTTLSAYAHPARLFRGDQGPITFWYRGYASAPSLRPGDTVRLDVWKNDTEAVARLHSTVGEETWQRIVWNDLPEGGLEVGAYRFRIIDDGDTLLGSGIFRVEGEENGATSVRALAHGLGQDVGANAEDDPLHSKRAIPDVKIVVTGDPASPGEPAVWSMTLINPENLTLVELQAEVCLPPGWSLISADVPSVEAQESADLGKTCRLYLLGTLQGHREKKVRLTLHYWDVDPTRLINWRSEMSIRLTGALKPGGLRVLIREARIPLAPADDPLLRPSLDIQGRVFIDVNGTGVYEDDEPVVAGAKIMVNGREIATANRRGEYRAKLTEIPFLIWAASERGVSSPRSVAYEELWAAQGRLDLAISPVRQVARGPVASAEDESGYFLLLTKLDAGSEGSEVGASMRAGAFGSAGGLSVEVKGGAGWDADRHDEWLLDDLRLSGFAAEGGVNLQYALQTGVQREIKMGLLKPTKPAETAYRFKLDIDPRRSDVAVAVLRYASAGRPDAPTTGRWNLGGEWGYARGDVWSCRMQEATAAYVTQGGRIAASLTQSAHERTERRGFKEGEAEQIKVELDGALMWSDQRWPIHLEVVGGRPRKLSPSCGLSPFDGWKWRAIAAAPVGAGIQGIEWSGMSWPWDSKGEGAKKVAGSAYELGLSFRPIYVREKRIDLSTAVQWEKRDGKSMGSPRLATRLRSRIGGLHDIRLELGALALTSTDNPDRLARGEHRLAVSWRVTRGQVRPWLKYELYSLEGVLERDREFGLQLSKDWSLSKLPTVLHTTLRTSRSVDSDDVKDKLRVDVRLGPSTGRFEWSGTAPVAVGDAGLAAFEAYERRDWKLLFEGTVAEGAGEWSVSLDGASGVADAEWAGLTTVGGRWSFGRSGVGRWQAGLGRGVTQKDGEAREFNTAVFRVGGKHGPWGVQAEAVRKVTVHDTALEHAAYHVTLRRRLGNEWAALAGATWSFALGENSGWRYRTGLERRLGNEESDPESDPEVDLESNPESNPSGVAFVIGLVWEVPDGPSLGQKGPRFEASLALPYLW